MASAITHFVVAAGLALPASQSQRLRAVLPAWAIPVTAGLLAVAPDLDTWAMQLLEIPRGSLFAHRGVFHSAAFLALVAVALAAIVSRHARPAFASLALLWAACAITHPLLDMLTDGGSGVMLFFPFSTDRLFFPWRPIAVSPLGILRFFSRGGAILRSEAPFDAAAVALGAGLLLFVRTQKRAGR